MFAVVEIMGRRTRAGMIGDAQLGGATMLRIGHPTRRDPDSPDDPYCEYYSPQALFAISPCSYERAQQVAGWAWPDPEAERTRALDPAFDEMVHDEDDDYEDGQEPWT